MNRGARAAGVAAAMLAGAAAVARADVPRTDLPRTDLSRTDLPVPPWIEEASPPMPSWARSVVPKQGERGMPGDMVLLSAPNHGASKRGVTTPGATLPVYGARSGAGCAGRWWLVGPYAWTCSDAAMLGAEEPVAPPIPTGSNGLPRDYFFVGHEGASAYASLDSAEEGTPDRELEGGWGVGVVEERSRGGERWARTSKGLWIAQRDLGAAHPSGFRGETLGDGPVDLAWVLPDKASVMPKPAAKGKAKDSRARFQVVHVLEESGPWVRIGDDAWMMGKDLARPHVAPPPSEVTGASERWIDVELASQTLVAYEGSRPVYTTLVSTGRGPQGSDSATPFGVHRIWVKILASDMDNVERDDLDAHYSLEDVPYVQFFDHAVGLHGTYWHRDFGHVKSHGCVNLAPLDARWMFDFTGPRLPTGWAAAYPTPVDKGTVVRVR